jgi:hypothetical protein
LPPFTDMLLHVTSEETPLQVTCGGPYVTVQQK